jgi:hypothetical protein
MRWEGQVTCLGGRSGAYRILTEKPKKKKNRRKMEDNIKMDLKEIGLQCMD